MPELRNENSYFKHFIYHLCKPCLPCKFGKFLNCDNKGQLVSKANYQAVNFSKKRTNEFDFTTMIPEDNLFLFVFWKKLKTPKRHFQIN